MTTFGITRSKNEVDIVSSSLQRMATHVDHIIIGDNSDDGTREEIEKLVADGWPITLHDDTALSWQQCDVMTAYAREAAEHHAQWVIPFDIDEVFHSEYGRIADRLEELPEEVLIAVATNVTHCVTDEDDPSDPDPLSRMGWRNAEVLPLGKIACRTHPGLQIGHGNHSAAYAGVRHAPSVHDVIGARHFPYRSPEQFIKRVEGAWPPLRDSGLPRTHGAHMWGYGELLDAGGPDALREWFDTKFTFRDPANNPEIVFDPLPRLER